MKGLKSSLAAKITAIILSFVTAAVMVLSVISVIFMLNENFYGDKLEDIKKNIIASDSRVAINSVNVIQDLYNVSTDNTDYSDIHEYADSVSVYYEIKDTKTEATLLTNYDGEDYIGKYTAYDLDVYIEKKHTEYNDELEEYENYTEMVQSGKYVDITVYITDKTPLTSRSKLLLGLSNTFYKMRYSIIVIGVLSALMFVILICWLCAAAGHRADGTVQRNYLDKVPSDIVLAAVITLAVLSAVIISDAAYGRFAVFITVTALTLAADYFIALATLLTAATRLKTKTLFKNSVIYRLFSTLGRFFKYIFGNISLAAKTAAVCGAVILTQLVIAIICVSNYAFFLMTVLWFILLILASAIIIFTAISMQKIKQGGEKIAAGDLEHKIDTKYMYADFKEFAESLNNINDGLSVAVEEKMKSERFKTELITNVSHDIKTPLTSIINYVDLIKKEEPEDGKIREYIEVLDRQSSRLKKLIEDLVEASKASTGNLAVNLTECEVGVLLSQTIGEFDERLNAAGLTAVLKTPEKPVKIMADGRHLWRVFDNLMTNVCKYSLRGTRVYMDVAETNGKAVVTFRNISAYELNISSEELMERFVRGDKSRNTEGSGLGLSIARSLTEIQNGNLSIEVDGDLFKVILTFNAI